MNQLVRTEITYPRSVGYRQSLCAFISSQSKIRQCIGAGPFVHLTCLTLVISYPLLRT